MITYLVEPLSTYAAKIDFAADFITLLVGFWLIVTQAAFFWLLWRFRKRQGVRGLYVTGKEKHLKRWVSWPHYIIILCDFFIVAVGLYVWYDVKQYLPPPEAEIEIWSQQWAWSFVHPGSDGKLGTEDDIKTADELHVVKDTVYHFKLFSRDVIHSFSVPVFRIKQDAVPGREITGWFEATKTGTYDILCTEMCGIGHGIMAGRIVIETPAEHAAWIAANSPSTL